LFSKKKGIKDKNKEWKIRISNWQDKFFEEQKRIIILGIIESKVYFSFKQLNFIYISKITQKQFIKKK